MSSSTATSKGLRVLLAGFEVDPDLPESIAGVPVDVVDRARDTAETVASVEAVQTDVVLGDSALVGIACLQYSGAVAFLRADVAQDFVRHGRRSGHAVALDVVEAVLAVASIRAYCAIGR